MKEKTAKFAYSLPKMWGYQIKHTKANIEIERGNNTIKIGICVIY